jgi:hypothetical protein
MEAKFFSKTLFYFQRIAQHYIPETDTSSSTVLVCVLRAVGNEMNVE